MSTIQANAILDASGGNTVTVNGVTPNSDVVKGRNLIINGAMQVAQRGTSSTSSGYGAVDRFKNGVQTIAVTQSQGSITSGAPFEEGFLNYYRQTVTTPSSASNVIMEIKHAIESQDMAGSGWDFKNPNKSLTLSFYVRSSVAGTYYCYIRNTEASPELFYRFSYTLSANTWTKVEKTIVGNSSLTFSQAASEGLALFWVPSFGTDYSGSSVNLDQWETLSGSDYIPDITHAWGNTNGATFDLTGVKLEVGSVATEFDHRSYGEELELCKRYYQLVESASGMSASTTNAQFNVPFSPEMRSSPSVSISDVNGLACARITDHYFTDTILTSGATITLSNVSKYGARTQIGSFSGLTQGRFVGFLPGSSYSSFMRFDAEL